jgi:hypothetical protein
MAEGYKQKLLEGDREIRDVGSEGFGLRTESYRVALLRPSKLAAPLCAPLQFFHEGRAHRSASSHSVQGFPTLGIVHGSHVDVCTDDLAMIGSPTGLSTQQAKPGDCNSPIGRAAADTVVMVGDNSQGFDWDSGVRGGGSEHSATITTPPSQASP